jgi:hypothetical protein
MKRTLILTSVFMISASLLLSGCGPSRVYATTDRVAGRPVPPPPPPRFYKSSVSLIISPQPGFRMNESSKGRYYHRTSQGLLYWKGYDNRFYLDRKYFNRVHYSKWEYKEWKKYYKKIRK